jgi:large subunit ribosomal protein L14
MLNRGSYLEIIDNSGAKEAKCICVLEGFFNKTASIGSLIVVSIRKLRLIRKVKLGQIFLAIIVRTKSWQNFKDGSASHFTKNCIVLLTRKKQLFGNKITGPVSRNLRKKKYMRLLLVSGSFIL